MIFVFGSTNIDQVGRMPRFPAAGETVTGSSYFIAPGGKGANQALAAARAGAAVRHVSAVGDDGFAEVALRLLRAEGIDVSAVRVVGAATGTAMIFLDRHGENMIAVLPGANGLMRAIDAELGLARLSARDILLLQQEVPQIGTRKAIEIARRTGALSVLNIAPFLDDTSELAALADIVVANESEFALLIGRPGGSQQDAMLEWADSTGRTIIVTLGAKGARAAVSGTIIDVPAHPVVPVDTVGAGDTFCGYLAANLDLGLDLEAAIKRAAIAGSLACLQHGAQPAIPSAADVDRAGRR